MDGQVQLLLDPNNTFEYDGRKRTQAPCPAGVSVGMIFVDTHGVDDYRFPILDQY
jgi:hypothetical protein